LRCYLALASGINDKYMYKTIILLFFALLLAQALPGQQRYSTERGSVRFKSDAPLELIEAASQELKGILDAGQQSFAFAVNINSFQGFNSPLQREHFNENYLESQQYPRATFSGKIIEQLDFSQDGAYEVRAKGKFTIHGVAQERIIKGRLRVAGKRVFLEASFSVLLAEHRIDIPRVVFQKIAEEIQVSVELELQAD
jgi:hypothetical protein